MAVFVLLVCGVAYVQAGMKPVEIMFAARKPGSDIRQSSLAWSCVAHKLLVLAASNFCATRVCCQSLLDKLFRGWFMQAFLTCPIFFFFFQEYVDFFHSSFALFSFAEEWTKGGQRFWTAKG